MLRPLPLPAVEQLARGLEPVRVPAGRAVFHQGDPGDRFYVIETGAADVVGDGRLVTTLGPGDGFGEIALLRRVPRTATVRAVTDLQLHALTCNRFLPVVTGFPPSARQAETSVEEDARPIQAKRAEPGPERPRTADVMAWAMPWLFRLGACRGVVEPRGLDILAVPDATSGRGHEHGGRTLRRCCLICLGYRVVEVRRVGAVASVTSSKPSKIALRMSSRSRTRSFRARIRRR